jgi:hypothetical protein
MPHATQQLVITTCHAACNITTWHATLSCFISFSLFGLRELALSFPACICMCVCARVCAHARTHTSTHTHTDARWPHMQTHARWSHIHTYTHIHAGHIGGSHGGAVILLKQHRTRNVPLATAQHSKGVFRGGVYSQKFFSCVVPLYIIGTRALTFFFSRMSGRPLPPCRSPSAGSWGFSQFSLL